MGFEQVTLYARGWFDSEGFPIFREKASFRTAVQVVGGMLGFAPLPRTLQIDGRARRGVASWNNSDNTFCEDVPDFPDLDKEQCKVIDAWVYMHKASFLAHLKKQTCDHEEKKAPDNDSLPKEHTMLDLISAIACDLGLLFPTFKVVFLVFDREDLVNELGLKDATHIVRKNRTDKSDKKQDERHVCTFRCDRPFSEEDVFPGMREVLRPCRKLLLRQLVVMFLRKSFLGPGLLYLCGHQLASCLPSRPSVSDSKPLLVTGGHWYSDERYENFHAEADNALFFYAAHVPCARVVISSVDTDIWSSALLLVDHDDRLSQKKVFVELNPKTSTKEGLSLDVSVAIDSLPRSLPPLVLSALNSVSGTDYNPYLKGSDKDTCLRTYMENIDFVEQKEPFVTCAGNTCVVSQDAFVRLSLSFFLSYNASTFPSNTTPASELESNNGDLEATVRSVRSSITSRFLRTPDRHMPTITAHNEQVKRSNVHLNLTLSATRAEPYVRTVGAEHGYWDNPVTGAKLPIPDHPKTLAAIKKFLKVAEFTQCGCSGGCSTFRCSCMRAHNQCKQRGEGKCGCRACQNVHNQELPCQRLGTDKRFECPYHEFYGKSKEEMEEIVPSARA